MKSEIAATLFGDCAAAFRVERRQAGLPRIMYRLIASPPHSMQRIAAAILMMPSLILPEE